jgi:hypothetical protein
MEELGHHRWDERSSMKTPKAILVAFLLPIVLGGCGGCETTSTVVLMESGNAEGVSDGGIESDAGPTDSGPSQTIDASSDSGLADDAGPLCQLENSRMIPGDGPIMLGAFCDELRVDICQPGTAGSPPSLIEGIEPRFGCALGFGCNGEDTLGADCIFGQADGGMSSRQVNVDEELYRSLCEMDALPAMSLVITCIIFV